MFDIPRKTLAKTRDKIEATRAAFIFRRYDAAAILTKMYIK